MCSSDLQMVMFAYLGVEMIGLTAGEAKNPQKTIPGAINSVFWRILLFYVGALFVIMSIYPWNEIGTQGSPFVMTFERMGIKTAAGIINFVVITKGAGRIAEVLPRLAAGERIALVSDAGRLITSRHPRAALAASVSACANVKCVSKLPAGRSEASRWRTSPGGRSAARDGAAAPVARRPASAGSTSGKVTPE